MSAVDFKLEAELRKDLGRGASRRLRRAAKVLGVVYGGDEAAVSVMLEQRHVAKALENEAIYSHILNLTVNGKKEKVVLRDLQRHPYRPIVLHMDFMRVKETDKIKMHIPLHFVGSEECPGVKNGGIINHAISDIELLCEAGKLPEFIEVDVSNLELDQSIHISQLKLPAGSESVQLAHGHDLMVVSVHVPKRTKLDEEEEAEAAALAAAKAAEEAAALAAAGIVVEAEATEEASKEEGKHKGEHQ